MDAPASLPRSLRTVDLTLLGVGAIIGGGIFASIGTAAVGTPQSPGAGPALMVSVLCTALACLLTALCYGELAARLPSAGSAYAYARAAFGPRLAWTIGWCLTLEYAVANVAVAISWGDYATSLLAMLGCPLPPQCGALLGAGCIAALSALLCRGSRTSARLGNLLVLVKIAILLLFVAVGVAVCRPRHLWGNWQPFMPHGLSGTLYGAATMFFSFIGVDSVATAAEEARQPQHSVPRAICGSLALCALLYIAVAAVLTGIAPLPLLTERLAGAPSQPLLAVLGLLGSPGSYAEPFLAVGALLAQTTALLAFQMAQARILFAMGRDGLLPRVLAAIDARHHTPKVATWTAGAMVMAATLTCRIDAMLDLADIGTLFIFLTTSLCLPRLRWRQRQAPSPRFLVPLGAYTCPALAAASCLTLMLCLPGSAWLGLAGWIVLGWAVRHSLDRCTKVP